MEREAEQCKYPGCNSKVFPNLLFKYKDIFVCNRCFTLYHLDIKEEFIRRNLCRQERLNDLYGTCY